MNNKTPQNKRIQPRKQTVISPARKPISPKKPVQQRKNKPVANVSKASQTANKKTPLQIANEKKYAAEIAQRKRQEELLKKQYIEQQRKLRKRKLEQLKIKTIYLGKNVLSGIVIALILFAIICFAYYRNMSKFDGIINTYKIEFFHYLDENSEDEAIIKQLDERQRGKETPKLVLSDSLYVNNDSLYIPFSEISSYFNFTMSGDNETRTILVGSSQSNYSEKSTAVFKIGTKQIILNGSGNNLVAASLLKNNELYIPIDFFSTYLKGIQIKTEIQKKQTLISITKTEQSVYFSSSANTTIDTPNVSDLVNNATLTHNYSIDFSEYEQYINPQNPEEYLILVNINNKLDETYAPDDLVDLIHTRKDRAAQQMRLAAAKSLEAFLKAAYANGHSDVTVTSAYRTYTYQSSLFNERLRQNKITYGEALAEAKTAEFTAYPGTSEHQTGLCCDMHNLPSAMQSFASEEAYNWLYEHAADFGFILRYPKSKEDITGINFEPWHFRFVGRYHAQRIMESGLCLEEYIETLSE